MTTMNEIVTTNAKDDEYVVMEIPQDRFFECKHGFIYSIPEHNVYQKCCDLDIEEPCNKCKYFAKKC